MTIALTESNFDREVKQCSVPVLVSFHPGGNSRTDSVDNFSERLNGALKCCTINAATQPRLTRKYKVRSLPTILLFNRGRVTDTIVGVTRTEQLMQILQ
ncbi:MAG: thioredoxin family protein [Oscillospiraceae bacterium]|nr:thioredoxin family protein [Oscillospiraceae bacterium]